MKVIDHHVLNSWVERNFHVVDATGTLVAVAHDRASKCGAAVAISTSINDGIVGVGMGRTKEVPKFVRKDHDVPVLGAVGLNRGREIAVHVCGNRVAAVVAAHRTNIEGNSSTKALGRHEVGSVARNTTHI